MMVRRTKLVSLVLVILSFVAADTLISVRDNGQFGSGSVLAQKKRSKGKKRATSRRRSKSRTSTRRRKSRRTASARRSRGRRGATTKQASAPPSLPSRTRTSGMVPDRVMEIQQALIERGFLTGSTGSYDGGTVEAMKAFQQAQGIRVTGYPTAIALQRLGLSAKPVENTAEESPANVRAEEGQLLKQ